MTNCGQLRFGHTQLLPYPIYNKRHNYIPSSRARRPRYTPGRKFTRNVVVVDSSDQSVPKGQRRRETLVDSISPASIKDANEATC